MKKSFIVITMLIGFSAIIFNSCSKSNDAAPTPVTPSTPSVTSVVGNWQKNDTTKVLVIKFNTDSTYDVSNSGTSFENGTYTKDASSVTLNATTAGCAGSPGKYSFSISGTALTLSLVSDNCTGRASTAPGVWNKK